MLEIHLVCSDGHRQSFLSVENLEVARDRAQELLDERKCDYVRVVEPGTGQVVATVRSEDESDL